MIDQPQHFLPCIAIEEPMGVLLWHRAVMSVAAGFPAREGMTRVGLVTARKVPGRAFEVLRWAKGKGLVTPEAEFDPGKFIGVGVIAECGMRSAAFGEGEGCGVLRTERGVGWRAPADKRWRWEWKFSEVMLLKPKDRPEMRAEPGVFAAPEEIAAAFAAIEGNSEETAEEVEKEVAVGEEEG